MKLKTLVCFCLCTPIFSRDCTIVSFGAEPILTMQNLKNRAEQLFQAQPGIKDYVAQITREAQIDLYSQLVDSIAHEALSKKYVHEKGLDTTPAFKESQ